MFTKAQLNLLIELNCDDWTPEHFRQLVQECAGHVLVTYINHLTLEQIQNLQLAIALLENLPELPPLNQ